MERGCIQNGQRKLADQHDSVFSSKYQIYVIYFLIHEKFTNYLTVKTFVTYVEYNNFSNFLHNQRNDIETHNVNKGKLI